MILDPLAPTTRNVLTTFQLATFTTQVTLVGTTGVESIGLYTDRAQGGVTHESGEVWSLTFGPEITTEAGTVSWSIRTTDYATAYGQGKLVVQTDPLAVEIDAEAPTNTYYTLPASSLAAIGSLFVATSNSVVTVGIGSKLWSVGADLAFVAGQYVMATSGDVVMSGEVTDYSEGDLTVDVDYVGQGSTPTATWQTVLAGATASLLSNDVLLVNAAGPYGDNSDGPGAILQVAGTDVAAVRAFMEGTSNAKAGLTFYTYEGGIQYVGLRIRRDDRVKTDASYSAGSGYASSGVRFHAQQATDSEIGYRLGYSRNTVDVRIQGGVAKITGTMPISINNGLVINADGTVTLPTSAGATGTLWNDGGTVKISP